MKRTTRNIDPRRVELKSRRYHVTVRKSYDPDYIQSGEFYYTSERAARAFVRRQFAEWNEGYGFLDLIPRGDWRGIWGESALQVEVTSATGETGCFFAQINDMENPHEVDHPAVYFVDMRESN